MEDSEEDEIEDLVEEEEEVMDLYNATIAEYWGISNDISQTCSHNVPIVLLQFTLLKIVHS